MTRRTTNFVESLVRGNSLRPLPTSGRPNGSKVAAVLFDRDGTLIVDVPFNSDPARVVAVPGARVALDRLRDARILTAVVSNQSGVALGNMTPRDVEAVNERMETLLGRLGPMFVCFHSPWAGCGCRKPAAGLLEAAAWELDVELANCVMIGDIGTDMEAARRAGTRAILVPTDVTKVDEIEDAPFVVSDLSEAVDAVLGGFV